MAFPFTRAANLYAEIKEIFLNKNENIFYGTCQKVCSHPPHSPTHSNKHVGVNNAYCTLDAIRDERWAIQ